RARSSTCLPVRAAPSGRRVSSGVPRRLSGRCCCWVGTAWCRLLRNGCRRVFVRSSSDSCRFGWWFWIGGVRRGGRGGRGVGGGAVLVGAKVGEAARRGSGDHGAVMQAVGMGLLLCSSLSWANGSLYSRRAPRPRSALVGTGMQLLCGGVVLLVVSALIGEP